MMDLSVRLPEPDPSSMTGIRGPTKRGNDVRQEPSDHPDRGGPSLNDDWNNHVGRECRYALVGRYRLYRCVGIA